VAHGDVVAFIDSDNLWLRDHLFVVEATLRVHSRAVLASTCPGFVTAGGTDPREAVVLDPLPRLLAANFVGSPTCIAVRREALEAIGGFDEGLRVADDTGAWLRLALRGPFAFLRRRTVVLRRSSDSLLVRGRDEGWLLDDWERMAARMPGELEAAGRPELVGRASGGVHFAAALRALARGDAEGVGEELASACALFPELSSEPGLVSGRLRVSLPGSDVPRERLRQLATAARAWPEHASPTAVALRVQAVAAALRAREPTAAVRLAAGLHTRAALTFAARVVPLVRSTLARRRSSSRARA
jgi:hypothetical protein